MAREISVPRDGSTLPGMWLPFRRGLVVGGLPRLHGHKLTESEALQESFSFTIQGVCDTGYILNIA